MTFDSVLVAQQLKGGAEQGEVAEQARDHLSVQAGEAAKNGAQSGAQNGADSLSPGQKDLNSIQDAQGNILIAPLNEMGEAGSDAQTPEGSGPANRIDGNDAQIGKELGDAAGKAGESIIEYMKRAEPSDKDREAAKKELAEGISKLIPPEDRKTLVGMQEALIDGNLESFQKLVGSLKDNPEKLAAMIKELNNGLDKGLWGGAHVQQDSKGNVLLYKENGNTAIEINPSTGETVLRPMEPRFDGTAVIQPGEVVGADAGKIMRDIGNEATESLVPNKLGRLKPGDPFNPFEPLDRHRFEHLKPNDVDPGFRIRPDLRLFDGIKPYYESK
ncbi:MAG: hypothetical protein AB7W16_08785 [Candidatus Obscuribacterales bacterium]